MITGDDHVIFEPLAELRWVGHCFTTRAFVEGGGGGNPGRVELVARLGKEFFPFARAFVWGEQVHGRGVARCGAAGSLYAEVPGVDALVCSEPGVCLVAFGADCPLVFIADRKNETVALVHAGRRGVERRAVTACLDKMREWIGTSPADCVVVIGPSIGPCCYPADLWEGIDSELDRLGVVGVTNPRACTSCRPETYFSYRHTRGRCGRMLAAICIAPK